MRSSGHMHWNIADWCNYRCSYCCEGRSEPAPEQRFIDEGMIAAGLAFLSGLPRPWVVRLSSGEPSAHPGLLDLVRRICALGHRAAMETNLSLPAERYLAFIAAAGGGLAYLHASLHLEQADPEEFLAKCLRLQESLRGQGVQDKLQVSAVALPERLAQIGELADRLRRQGLVLILQDCYDRRRRAFRPAPGGAISAQCRREAVAEFNREAGGPRGRLCAAGLRWLLLDFSGRLWRCQAARREEQASRLAESRGFLGDLRRGGGRRLGKPEPCPYECCLCPGRAIE
ncbi:MAG: radical SAM protein [Elusimicrobia bacterium]|nr:radical SAM protein [Elusimicrobiota bacterium]